MPQPPYTPSLGALRALDLLDKLGTASAVAFELGQTQGAISRQLKSLEEHIGVELIIRDKQRLYLTADAKSYLGDVRQGLALINSATAKLRSDHVGGTLTLAILPAFGMRWLMPKLSEFSARHPDITINMLTRLKPFDFMSEPIDAAVHFGGPDWENVNALRLMNEYLVPVASSTYLKNHPISDLASLRSATLLHMETRPRSWSDWFEKQGLAQQKTFGPMFDQFSTMTQAVLHSQGVALMPKYLIEQELASGKLEIVFDGDGTTNSAYYLVWPENTQISHKLRTFRDWLATWAEGDDALPR